MKNERINELQNFANNFNKNLQLSEVELEDKEIFKKLNNNINNKRNGLNDFNSITATPRSKSQFRPVINNINIYNFIAKRTI